MSSSSSEDEEVSRPKTTTKSSSDDEQTDGPEPPSILSSDDEGEEREVSRSKPATILSSDDEEEGEEKEKELSRSKPAKILSSDDEDDDEEVVRSKPAPILSSDEDDDDDDDDDDDNNNDKMTDEVNRPESATKSASEGEGDEVSRTNRPPLSSSDSDDDDEDDEEEGQENDEGVEKEADGQGQNPSSSDDEDVDRHEPAPIYDFDIMMAKKKEENSRKRKRRNYDIINDNDDIIADIINQMRDAMEADIEANKNRMAATRKLQLLPFVISNLRKIDLRDAFLDSDILTTITEWLAPLPDRSLPHFNIRESLLKILIDFNLYDVDRIKSSGIGKAVMYLYKHPKETKENKQRAKQLISAWSRPIFNLETSFNAISREEREERDLELMKKQRRISTQEDSDSEAAGPSSSNRRSKSETGPIPQKPGDAGWIPRARVPAPSMRDYVIRPRSKVDGDIGKNSKRPSNMLEKLMKTQQERRRANKQQRAVNMKIDRG